MVTRPALARVAAGARVAVADETPPGVPRHVEHAPARLEHVGTACDRVGSGAPTSENGRKTAAERRTQAVTPSCVHGAHVAVDRDDRACTLTPRWCFPMRHG